MDLNTQDGIRARYDELTRAGMTGAQAKDRIRQERAATTQPKPAQATQPPPTTQQQPSALRAGLEGTLEGATLGWGGEIQGLIGAVGGAFTDATKDMPFWERYEMAKGVADESRQAAKEAHPVAYTSSEVGGGVATGALGGGVAARGAAGALKTLAGAAGAGGVAGLGASDASLHQGNFGEAGKDAAVGAGLGLAGGVVGMGVSKALSSAAKGLQSLGRGRLFKAAVGQNKRAFTQMHGKKLFDKSTEYLDSMGIGFGDSTESIGSKLAKRSEALNEARDSVVRAMDAEVSPSISPLDVAERIEKEIGKPLKKLAANQREYRQIQSAIDDILNIGDDMTFAEAAAQRAAYQQRANYDRVGQLPASEEVNRRIARIWNDVIDEKAVPVLKKLGEKGDAYRELRHEYSLVEELLEHVNNRIAGNQSNRLMSPSDYGAGGIAGIMTGNPFLGVAAATGNHLARNYGNAAAGRTAINVARVAAASPRGARLVLESASRSGAMRNAERAKKTDPAAPPQMDDAPFYGRPRRLANAQ